MPIPILLGNPERLARAGSGDWVLEGQPAPEHATLSIVTCQASKSNVGAFTSVHDVRVEEWILSLTLGLLLLGGFVISQPRVAPAHFGPSLEQVVFAALGMDVGDHCVERACVCHLQLVDVEQLSTCMSQTSFELAPLVLVGSPLMPGSFGSFFSRVHFGAHNSLLGTANRHCGL